MIKNTPIPPFSLPRWSRLAAGRGFQFEFRTPPSEGAKAQPVVDKVTLEFEYASSHPPLTKPNP